MEYKLGELLDIPKLQALLDSLDELYSIPSAIIDMEGKILTATAWQDICTRFHRADPESKKECIKSDTHIVSELSKGKTQVVYKCPKGLVDTATPIVVDGKHIGNAFTGQFFLEPPDEEHFRRLAAKYGFDEEAYIEAMRKVPIIPEDKHKKNLKVLASLAEMLAEQGLKQKRQLKVEQALRESRETFKTLVEFTEAIHWEFDLSEGRFIYVSPQATKMTGYPPEEWTDLDSWGNMIHPDDRGWAVDFCLAQAKERKDHDFTYRIRTRQGKTKWLRDIVKVITENKVPVKLIGVMLDITEQKRMEAETIKAQKLESLAVLAGGIAHDFNNLLTAIYGNVSLAKLTIDAGSATYQKIIDIEKALAKTKDLTHQLLTFSKGGSPVRRSMNIETLIEDTVKFALSGTIVEASISIADDLKEVNVDEGQISQVIQNLVINAKDAMPDGGKLTVKAENISITDGVLPHLSAGNYVVIYIRDTGHGISEEHLMKIFDPFFTTKDSGSGLGLASSYSIIKRHNGALTVNSEEGHGAVFRIYLPVEGKESEAGEREAFIVRGQGRILVMDDEEEVRAISRELLKSLGYTVELTANGEEAVEKYIGSFQNGKPFDAVILDLTIKGGMGGRITIKKLLEIDPNVKAIVSSGYAESETLSNYRDFGFMAELSKPYTVERLSQVLHQAING